MKQVHGEGVCLHSKLISLQCQIHLVVIVRHTSFLHGEQHTLHTGLSVLITSHRTNMLSCVAGLMNDVRQRGTHFLVDLVGQLVGHLSLCSLCVAHSQLLLGPLAVELPCSVTTSTISMLLRRVSLRLTSFDVTMLPWRRAFSRFSRRFMAFSLRLWFL